MLQSTPHFISEANRSTTTAVSVGEGTENVPRQETERQQEETRALARSLFYEALRQGPQATNVCAPRSRRRRSTLQGKRGRPLTWTVETIRAAIQEYVRRTGEAPGEPAFRKASQHGLPARSTIQKHWRLLSDAIRDAGFVPMPTQRKPPPRRFKI